ncbi:hypothetical protein L6452_09828 [Arctium lappa]|uniref:Uncharacterized protein n=1 Tax=Arctium lappa TaxID=4217 RepID=A0ACB9DL42_ARCLA|nr:hypothetical protein L6452_09828 [Arctium lappa]
MKLVHQPEMKQKGTGDERIFERWRMVSAAGNVGGGFAAAGEDGDDGWIDRDEILQVAKEREGVNGGDD